MGKTFLDYLNFFIGLISAGFGFFGLYIGLSKNPNLTIIQWVLIGLSVLFAFLFLLFLSISNKNRRYKKAYKCINQAFSVVNELYENGSDINDLPHCLMVFRQFCSYISNAFKLITNRKCGTCIKFFKQGDNYDACVFTLCRDTESITNDGRVPPDKDKTNHYISGNTDFKYIFENMENDEEIYRSYFSNYLPLKDFYLNTSIDSTKYPPKCNFPIIKEIIRLIKWPLKYRSSITVPITLFSNQNIARGKIAGYLCVDSPRMGTFSKKYDVEILRGIADGIYTPMKKINEKHFGNVHEKIKLQPKLKKEDKNDEEKN